jgi:AbrB family looped-hinge helix DNA binding protein
MTYQVKITANGRMSLPADLRKRLGLGGGGALLIEETADGIVLRTTAQAVANAQAIVRKYTDGNPNASVDAFLANRRKEWGE